MEGVRPFLLSDLSVKHKYSFLSIHGNHPRFSFQAGLNSKFSETFDVIGTSGLKCGEIQTKRGEDHKNSW
jgi:hypothetical protein